MSAVSADPGQPGELVCPAAPDYCVPYSLPVPVVPELTGVPVLMGPVPAVQGVPVVPVVPGAPVGPVDAVFGGGVEGKRRERTLSFQLC